MMEHYKNLSGDSNVRTFETGPDFIRVTFETGETYKYSYKSAAKHHVEQLKLLAFMGRGLNTYINKYCKKLYEK